MPKQQRTMRVEQRSQLAAMQQMESRSDEELEAETRYKAAAQAILGARAAERYDAKKARAHFQRAIAAARPQERLQIRRMADASLALAERRAGRSEEGDRAARRRGADQPPAVGIAVHGPGRAAVERRDPRARARDPDLRRAGRGGAGRSRFGIVTGISAAAGGLSLDLRIFYSPAPGRRRHRGAGACSAARRMRAAQAKRAAAASGQ